MPYEPFDNDTSRLNPLFYWSQLDLRPNTPRGPPHPLSPLILQTNNPKVAWLPLRKVDKTRKTALADGSLTTAPAAEGWEAAGSGEGRADEEEQKTNPTKATTAAAAGDDDDDNASDSGLLSSRSAAPPGNNGGCDIISSKESSSLPGRQAVGEPARQETKAEARAEGEEQEAMESGERGEEALTQPLLVSTSPAWN